MMTREQIATELHGILKGVETLRHSCPSQTQRDAAAIPAEAAIFRLLEVTGYAISATGVLVLIEEPAAEPIAEAPEPKRKRAGSTKDD